MSVVCVHCETSLGGAPSVIYAVFLDPHGAWIHGLTWLDKFWLYAKPWSTRTGETLG
jgi:hypothetical protein